MRNCIIKPIVWNTYDYERPSGYGWQSGYPKENGFGHEEWNNNANMIWQGWRVFHAQSLTELADFSEKGNLLMLMIASREGEQVAVGIAAGVYHNSEDEMKYISKDLRFIERENELWAVKTVQKAFNSQKELSSFWKKQHTHMQWKCRPELFYWFPTPIPLTPLEITGKQKLVTMYGSYQQVSPETLSQIIEGHLPKNHDIWCWLAKKDFTRPDEQNILAHPPSDTLASKRKGTGSNAPTKAPIKYWVYGNRTAEPHHALLQSRYVNFLKNSGMEPIEDKNYIDVQYTSLTNEKYFVEIKPTETVATKYAIRAAIGQLFEYQYTNDRNAKLEIVLGSKPTQSEVDFVKNLNIAITYFDSNSENFLHA